VDTFENTLKKTLGTSLSGAAVQTIQINVGSLCNLACRHCHVDGSPQSREVMDRATMESVLRLAAAFPEAQIDITGGAPELNPNFRSLVEALFATGHPLQVRSNLSVFYEPGMAGLPEFYREHGVQLVASLPCYLEKNVTAQRGAGVFDKSIRALGRLNELGYGLQPGLRLNLVYNPGGPFLPPGQIALEADYRTRLRQEHGIVFTRLLTLTNMPLGRFLDDLQRQGKESDYRRLLVDAFNPGTVEGLMCRHQICVAWDGTLADCDFNLALGLSLSRGLPTHIDDIDPALLAGRPIVTGEHCFGCTAGCGSSCGGALVA
jgi:radical SAM/Cys-rich protein